MLSSKASLEELKLVADHKTNKEDTITQMNYIETLQKMLAGVTELVKESVFLSMSIESANQIKIKQRYLFD
jgi:predicted TPR repeat methyltransferase